jgi:hypothetical protein
MGQPPTRLFKRIALAIMILLTLSGCRLVSYLKPTASVPTPTQTPTPESCAWTWAYGDGSSDFDNTVTEKLTEEGIIAAVKSSSYGEVNSCGNTYSAMALDVKVEIRTDNLAHQDFLVNTSEKVFSLLRDNLSLSNVNNLGNVSLTFITPDGSTCYWDQSQHLCAD